MKQIIGITKVKDPDKFRCLLKKYYPNIPNNKFNALVLSINHNNFVWYIRCEKDEIRSILEYCNLLIEPSKHMKQNQFEFKPFDKVLVRDLNQGQWRASVYSHLNDGKGHVCVAGIWTYCIPYNENTAYLLGTCEPYKEPEPKVWHVVNIKNGEPYEFTHNEFEHFIKTAVLNNKDITDFNARYVNN